MHFLRIKLSLIKKYAMQHSFSPSEYSTQWHTACVIKPKVKEHGAIKIFHSFCFAVPTLGKGGTLGFWGIV